MSSGRSSEPCRLVVPANHGVKMKESKKIDKYLGHARGLKKVEREGNGYTKCG